MDLLSIAQIIISILLIVAILLQQKGALLGAGFGGGGDASFQHIRRGPEKKLYYITIILAVAFLALSIIHLIT